MHRRGFFIAAIFVWAACGAPQLDVTPGVDFRDYDSVSLTRMPSGPADTVQEVLTSKLLACGVTVTNSQEADLVMTVEHGGGLLPWRMIDSRTRNVVASGKGNTGGSRGSAKKIGDQLCMLLKTGGAVASAEPAHDVPSNESSSTAEIPRVGDGVRTALVIGNGRYESGRLANPPRDARLVSGALRKIGFDVTEEVNADQKEMKRAIERFGADLKKKRGVGLFYFAGHGLQVNGRNYLVPIGAKIDSEGSVDIETVHVGRVLAKMDDAASRLNIVVLDACRNNPFARSFRSPSRGLAFVDAPEGTLVAYATAPGAVAADGSGKHSPYTEALVGHFDDPGVPIERMFKAVRIDVKKKTRGKQTPWESSSLTTEFYFAPKD